MAEEQQVAEPPKPPEIKRKIAFYPTQLVVMCLVAAIPLLALLGVFGIRSETVSGQDASLHVQVEYPRLFRYKTDSRLNITVENTSGQALDGVIVRVSREYMNAFAKIGVLPEVSHITTDAYEIELDALPSGESRIVSIDVEGGQTGQLEGVVSVSMPDAEALQLTITTLVFP